MKNYINHSWLSHTLALIVLLTAVTSGCKKDPPKVIPTLSTTNATEITSATATVGGTISDDGGAFVTACGVCWSTSQGPTIAGSKVSGNISGGNFSCSITGLNPGTTYYAIAYAINSVGTAYGTQITFTTQSVLPQLTTTEILGISTTAATCGGDITNDGGASIIARGVCWSTKENPTTDDEKTINGMGSGVFASSIAGLAPGTKYYVRAYAT
ncbi:MAG: hypothetical protein WCX48_11550, partial [Bacteroidales bacterium]